MHCFRFALAVIVFASLVSHSLAAEPLAKKVVYNEAEQGDFGSAQPQDDPALKLDQPGVHIISGVGIDAIDDADAFVFEVAGERPFDFFLQGDAAEFKKLRSINKEGEVQEIAFGSTNARFGKPRNIAQSQLPPGRYHVEMYFGPQAAIGNWVAKIAIGEKQPESFFAAPPEASSAEKMAEVDWPGAITIYHGYNWGDDTPYVTAIKEAGFQATGAAEWQVEQCEKNRLRAFVFIWPHESATIPPKFKENKTVLCYYLSDRVQPNKWSSWATMEQICVRGDPHHPAVFTMRGLWGGIDQFCPVVEGRAMEFYHYHWDGNRSPHMHFALLEQYRQASLKNGDVPVCRIVEVRPEDMRKTRQTVYTNLAYGVRGFRMGGAIFDTNDRDDRGVPRRNAYGEELLKINQAVNAYSPIFKTTRCKSVYHTAPLPAGCVAAGEDSWILLEGKEVLVGVFEEKEAEKDKPSADYLLVSNRDAFATRTANLKIARPGAKLFRMEKATGKWTPHLAERTETGISAKVDLEEGSGELLKVEGGED